MTSPDSKHKIECWHFGVWRPVVRIAPNEVSSTSYEAVKEIYGSLGSGYDKSTI